MIDLTTLPLSVTLPTGFLGGLIIGYGYFRALRETTNLIVGEGAPLKALALTLGRLSLVGTGFFIAVLAGGAPLLAALAGLLCAKALMMRQMRKEAP
ncbi:N-ATPase subunit AtpR [Sulfitobacter sp.]|uniref:N-ATPase subunit AtpR n=1 Tax=Sulfitobacter sp. TaxID=1903071 RepID=UPI0030011011